MFFVWNLRVSFLIFLFFFVFVLRSLPSVVHRNDGKRRVVVGGVGIGIGLLCRFLFFLLFSFFFLFSCYSLPFFPLFS